VVEIARDMTAAATRWRSTFRWRRRGAVAAARVPGAQRRRDARLRAAGGAGAALAHDRPAWWPSAPRRASRDGGEWRTAARSRAIVAVALNHAGATE